MKISILNEGKKYLYISLLTTSITQILYLKSFFLGFFAFLCCICITLLILYIFRFPSEDIAFIDSITSPCDGSLTSISHREGKSIAFSIDSFFFDRYIKYSPDNCIVKSILEYSPEHLRYPGGFEITLLNEKNIVIKIMFHSVVKTICLVKVEQKIRKAEPIALCFFQSYLEIEIFSNFQVLFNIGDNIVANRSHLAINTL